MLFRLLTRASLALLPLIVAARAGAAAPSWCEGRCDAVVTGWSSTAYLVIRSADGYADPMAASRSLAMMHAAMHDAVNAVQPRYERYALTVAPKAGAADPAVAAAVAAHDVLVALYPQPQAVAVANAALEQLALDFGVGPAVEGGKTIGRAAAAAVLEKRRADGASAREPWPNGTKPGEYRFTAPFDFAAAPHWRNVTPFSLDSVSQFRTAPPPALASDAYARDFDEVKRKGGKVSRARTADEAHHAAFWYEFSDIGWNRVARVAAGHVRQDLHDRARTFALLNMAMADAYIAGWDSKYHYNFWRPVTAIREASSDGNPKTAPDAKFDPLLVTPPVPDMPSTHSALGMAAAVVLAGSLGRDDLSFSFASPTADPANPLRQFTSFSAAARENAESRVVAGLHFRFACEAGLELGRRIGEHALRESLRPQVLSRR